MSSRAALAEAEAARPADASRPRGLAQAAARHHRSDRRQGPRRRGPRRSRHRSEQSRRLHRHGRHRRRRALRDARLGARPRGAGARQLGLFPRPRRADAAGAHLQRSVLAAPATRTARRSRCAWSIGADGRKRRTRFHRVLMRSAAKLHYAQAQAAIDGAPTRPPAPCSSACSSRSMPPMRRSSASAHERQPLDLDLPERKILLKPDGTVDRVDHAAAARRAPADRGVHDPRQRGGGRDAGAARAAADLSRARRAVAGEARSAARIPRDARHLAAPRAGALRPEHFNQILRGSRAASTSSWSTRWCCARQAQAEYAAENYGHFGLNLRRYAHFTSPIRRYADLIVHRALIRAQQLRRRRPARGAGPCVADRDRGAASRPPSGAP